MKTQILRLETHDTVTSICDKLTWAKSPRILLAFPRRRPPLLGRIDLTLIQRGAARVGGQLAISTLDAKITAEAKIIGIPVFTSIPAAQRLSWRIHDRRRVRTFRPRETTSFSLLQGRRVMPSASPLPNGLRVGVFILGMAAFLSLIALFLPSAIIELPVEPQTQALNLTVYPGVGIPGVLPGGQIPAFDLLTTVEGQLETAATGEIIVPDQSAQALVMVTNQTGQAVVLPAGVVLLVPGSPSQHFLTLTSVEVPAGRGQQVKVQARADLPGTVGNVAEGAINSILGPVGLQVTVVNTAPAEGGTDHAGRAASESDYVQLYDQLLTSLNGLALNQLTVEAPQSLVIPESLGVVEVLSETRQPAAGQPTDRLKLTLKVTFSAMAVNRADLNAAATAALDSDLPVGLAPIPDSISLTQNAAWVVIPGQRLTLDLVASRSTSPILNTADLFSMIRGLKPVDAGGRIQSQLNLNRQPVIRISPSWWPRLPVLPFRIRAVTS